MWIILLKKQVTKDLQNVKKSKFGKETILKINAFLERLKNSENPTLLPNAKKLKGYDDNHYRWRIGDYRIIGIVENGEIKLIEIIKIVHRQEAYKD